MRVAGALRHLAGDQIVQRLIGQHADLGVDQRGVDIGALAGLLALHERGENADDRIDAGDDVGDRNADALRLAVRRAGEIHDAAHALRHQIVAGARGIGSVLAEAGDRAIDQARIVLAQARLVEPELGEPADLEVLDQHIGARGELFDDAAAFLALEIKLDRALAAIGGMEIGGAEMRSAGGLDERRPPAAGVVAGALALDLDDVGAKIGQQLPGPGTGKNAGKFQHAQDQPTDAT